jgi:hypothetical protein
LINFNGMCFQVSLHVEQNSLKAMTINELIALHQFVSRFSELVWLLLLIYKKLMFGKEIHVSIASSYVTSMMCMTCSIMEW